MVVKLSENARYLEYMTAFAEGEYEAARRALEACLANAGRAAYQSAFLLQRLGEISFLEGHDDRSITYFKAAEEADPTSLQPRLVFAGFLAHRLERHAMAIGKCDEILLRATASRLEETEEELSSDYYIRKADELKALCEKARLRDCP